jgi:hypothetical protein
MQDRDTGPKTTQDQPARPPASGRTSRAWTIGLAGVIVILLLLFALVS